MHRLFILALILLVLACGAPRTVTTPTRPTRTPKATAMPEPTKQQLSYVSHAEFGDAWPLEVEDGTIFCDGASILLRTNRGLYAVNGTARGQHRWKDIKDITRPDPHTAGLLMDVQPIVDRGLKYCSRR